MKIIVIDLFQIQNPEIRDEKLTTEMVVDALVFVFQVDLDRVAIAGAQANVTTTGPHLAGTSLPHIFTQVS